MLQWLGLERREDVPPEQPPPGSGVRPPKREEAFGTDQALGLISVYRATAILATAAQQLSLDVWRGSEPLDKPALVRQPDPDPKVSLSTFLAETVTSLALHGNSFWRFSRNARGEVTSAKVLDPLHCHPHENGTLSVAGRTSPLVAKEFAHLKLLPITGRLLGLGPIQAARVELLGARDLRDYAGEWFHSGDVPSGLLKSDQVLTPEQARIYREQWEAREAHSVAVLGSGLDYRPILLSPKDAQFLEVRQFTTTDIARLFGIPSHLMLAAVEGTSLTYQNMHSADLGFVRWTLAQYTRPIEEAFTAALPGQQTARFNLDGLIRPDIATRYEAHASAIDAGWMTPDEVRAIEGLPPLTPQPQEARP